MLHPRAPLSCWGVGNASRRTTGLRLRKDEYGITEKGNREVKSQALGSGKSKFRVSREGTAVGKQWSTERGAEEVGERLRGPTRKAFEVREVR